MQLQVIGKVHPQPGGWVVEGVRELRFPDGKWHIAIRQSSVVAIIEAAEPPDFATFINEVRSLIGRMVDALGFELANPLRFEPTHAIRDGGEVVAFIQSGWPELLQVEQVRQSNEDWVAEDQLAPMINAVVAVPLIRYAISDAQRAIESPDDTAFYCYRAIESLRLLFLDGDDDSGSARAESWRRLRTELDLSREELDAVKGHADQRRHGGHHALAEQDVGDG